LILKPSLKPGLGAEPQIQEPQVDLPTVHPEPVRREFALAQQPLTTKDLLNLRIGLGYHRRPETFGDHVAYNLTKLLRLPTDLFFKKKYIHRAVMLETVAAVPGMVAGMLRHLTSLRTMKHDGGWIHHLLAEAENERMHLLTWMKMIKPTPFDRLIVLATQGVFFNCYFVLYLFFPKTAHRFVGYLEEEAVISYTAFLKEIDAGRIKNVEAPPIAKWYWRLAEEAKLRDVVLAIRADEAAHRDVNHNLSDRLKYGQTDLRQDIHKSTTISD
jgi:ubiquinol oxidase